MKKFLLAALFMTFFLRAAACSEPAIVFDGSTPKENHQGTEFQDELSLSARKVVELARVRFSRIKSVNDSYQLTAEASLLLAERGDIRGAIPLLRKAVEKFDGNRLAYLLLGSAFERVGDKEGAAEAYAEFYKNSLTLSPEENKLIDPSALMIFRNYIEILFEQWRIPLPESKVGLGLQRARSMVMLEGSPVGERINLILPMIVVAGFVLLIVFRLTGTEFPFPASYFFVSFYLLCVLAYVLWVAHLFMGLPFFISPGTEYKVFFSGGAVGITVLYAFRRFLFHKTKKIEGTQHCPVCGEIMSNLNRECPKCKHRMPG